MIRWIFTLVVLWTGCNASFSQVIFKDYTVESWTVKNGLPTELILSITRDSQNVLWLNTYEGLIQFDGVRFRTFNAGTHPQFKTNNIYPGIVDAANNLWLPTQFDQFIKINRGKLEVIDPQYALGRIQCKFPSGDILIWNYNQEYIIFNPQTKLYTKGDRKQPEPLLQLISKNPDCEQLVTLPDGRRLFLFNRWPRWVTSDTLVPAEQSLGLGDPRYLSYSEIKRVSTGEIFLVGDNTLKIWDRKQFKTYPGCDKINLITLGASRFPLLVEDHQGNLWLGHSNGVALRRKGTIEFEFLSPNHPLGGLIVTSLDVDKENNLWVGSENGLFKITEGKIKVWSSFGDVPLKRTTGVAQMTNGEIYFHVPGTNSLYVYQRGKLSTVGLKSEGFNQSWEAFHLHGDRQGNLWIGSGGLSLRLGKDNQEWLFGPGKQCRYIYEDEDGKIWFGLAGEGVGYLDQDTLKLLNFKGPSLAGEAISTIRKINGKEWIITTFGNGFFWANEDLQLVHYKDTLGFPAIGAFNIYQEAEGTFWLPTNLGLYFFDGKKFIKIKGEDDNLENSFFEILADKHQNLWLTGNKGIVRIERKELNRFLEGKIEHVQATRYDEGDGMLNRQCTGARHSIVAQDGKIYVPTLYGLAIVDPESQSKNSLPPEVIAGPLYINGEIVDSLSPAFEAGNHQYVIEYSATSYVAPSRVQFKYKLEGYDQDWSKPTKERKVIYTNLPHGTYTFRVKAGNNDQVWNEEGAQLVFRVKPYYYQTWWFKGLIIVLLSGLISLIIRWRSGQITRRNKVLKEIVSLRTKELNDSNEELRTQKLSLEKTLATLNATQSQLIQSEKMASLGELTAGIAHEIQNPLNFVNNFSEVNNELVDELADAVEKENYADIKSLAADIKRNQEKIHLHGKRADAIVKSMLQHSRSNTGVKEPTDLNALCDEYLRLSYHGLRAKDTRFTAKYNMELDPQVGKININGQDISRVLLNLFNNAFYAVNKRAKDVIINYDPVVNVQTKKLSDTIEIIIMDNGGGIPAALKDKIFQPFFTTKPTGEGTGLGLSLAYDIVTQGHGGELIVETEEGESTTFKIVLPATNLGL